MKAWDSYGWTSRNPFFGSGTSDGYIAEAGAGRLAYARRVPFEFMLFEPSGLSLRVTHADVLHDYVHEVATPLEGGGWKFNWRHPSLSSFVRLPDGCFLAAVGRLPETVEGRLPEVTDFYTELVFLSDQGRVLHRQTLSFYFRPIEAWKDPGGRNHLLGIGRDKATGLDLPIQYLAVGTTPREGPGALPTMRFSALVTGIRARRLEVFSIYEIGEDYILTSVRDELRVEYVQLWPLERSGDRAHCTQVFGGGRGRVSASPGDKGTVPDRSALMSMDVWRSYPSSSNPSRLYWIRPSGSRKKVVG